MSLGAATGRPPKAPTSAPPETDETHWNNVCNPPPLPVVILSSVNLSLHNPPLSNLYISHIFLSTTDLILLSVHCRMPKHLLLLSKRLRTGRKRYARNF